jgi:hypothetical protein
LFSFLVGAECENYAAMQQKQGAEMKFLLRRTLNFAAPDTKPEFRNVTGRVRVTKLPKLATACEA